MVRPKAYRLGLSPVKFRVMWETQPNGQHVKKVVELSSVWHRFTKLGIRLEACERHKIGNSRNLGQIIVQGSDRRPRRRDRKTDAHVTFARPFPFIPSCGCCILQNKKLQWRSPIGERYEWSSQN